MKGMHRHQNPRIEESASREQESRDAVELDTLLLEDDGPLPNIPPRPGYSQRWIRVAIKKDSDARNISVMSRRGWTPRSVDTVDKAFRYMLTNHEGVGGVIGTHDLVLMERPIEIQRRAEKNEREKVRNLEYAVKRNLFREHSGMGGPNSGFTAPRDESSARVVRGDGRLAQIADD